MFSRYRFTETRSSGSLLNVEYLSKTLLWDNETSVLTTAWTNFYDVFFLRFDKTGTVLTNRQITFNDSNTLSYTPILAQGPWIAMIWQELKGLSLEEGIRNVRFVALDTNGDVLREMVLSDEGIYPWIASNGQSYLSLAALREEEPVEDVLDLDAVYRFVDSNSRCLSQGDYCDSA